MITRWSQLFFWLISAWLLSSSPVLADGYDKGLEAYRNEDYAKAYKILSGVVKKKKDKTEKAEAMALMGAAAAKLGKKGKAESLFAKALKLDPSVGLAKDVMQDKTVKKLFSKAKRSDGGDDDGFDDSGDDSGSESKSSGGGSGSLITGIIPLGLGYILEGEYSKGLIYGGAQAAGLVGFLYYNIEIDKANKDADGVGKDALDQKQKTGKVDQANIDFLDQNENFVKAAQRNQTLLLLVGAAGYGLSVADPFIFGGGGSSSSGGKAKKGKKRADNNSRLPQSLAAHQIDDAEDTDDEDPSIQPQLRPWDLRVHYVPRVEPGLMLSLTHRF